MTGLMYKFIQSRHLLLILMKSLLYNFTVVCLFCLTAPTYAEEPTFTEHIAPIIFKNCVSCHRQGEIAPFPLTNYQEVKSHATMIKFVTATRFMPPWKPVHGYGSFADERSLTTEQINLITKWVDNNMSYGDSTKLPALPEFPNGSQLGTPDLVLKMTDKFTVRGDYKDTYRTFVIPTELLEDRNIAAIEFRPGNPRIVHHVSMFLDTAGIGRKLDALDSEYGYSSFGGVGFVAAENLLGWVPGLTPHFFPATLGLYFRKQSDILLLFHYAPSATEESDQSTLNIFFKKTPEIRPISQFSIAEKSLPTGQSFLIPAQKTKTFTGTSVIDSDISLMAIAPHMHLLGQSAKAFAITPVGDTIPLIAIDSWSFNWQGVYYFNNLVKLPKGSVVYYEATYDNTSDNPENPNFPPKPTSWGELTVNEMFLCYFFYVPYKSGDETIGFTSPTSVGNDDNATLSHPTLECYPNPASESGEIKFTLTRATDVSLSLCNMVGMNIMDIIPQQVLSSGKHSIAFSTENLSAGQYICKLQHSTGQPVSVLISIVH